MSICNKILNSQPTDINTLERFKRLENGYRYNNEQCM